MRKFSLFVALIVVPACKTSITPVHDATIQDAVVDIPALVPMAPSMDSMVPTEDVPCASKARDFGAIPDDGLDDIAGLRAAAASGCPNVQLEAGVYQVAVPPLPRPRAMLDMKGVLSGAGQGTTTIKLTGSGSGQDLIAVSLIANGAGAQDLTLDMTGIAAGTTNEQTHAFGVDGRVARVSGVRVTRVKILNPYGDCVDLVGYEPLPDGTGDFRISVRIDHAMFQVCGRSGITFFGGCNDCEFDHITGVNVSDQIFDGEGKGGGSHRVKIHDNKDRAGVLIQSTLAIDVQNSSEIEIFDNDFDRGISLARCFGCSVHHTTITQTRPSDPLISITKEGDTQLYNLKLTREASAGPGSLVSGSWSNGTGPTSVTLVDSTLIQKTDALSFEGHGIKSLIVQRVDFQYSGSLIGKRDSIYISGGPQVSGNKASISISDSRVSGALRYSVHLDGAYMGIANITFKNIIASAKLYCENTTTTATAGGIRGPLIIDQCAWPPQTCPGL